MLCIKYALNVKKEKFDEDLLEVYLNEKVRKKRLYLPVQWQLDIFRRNQGLLDESALVTHLKESPSCFWKYQWGDDTKLLSSCVSGENLVPESPVQM
jgi:hypothetical protein